MDDFFKIPGWDITTVQKKNSNNINLQETIGIYTQKPKHLKKVFFVVFIISLFFAFLFVFFSHKTDMLYTSPIQTLAVFQKTNQSNSQTIKTETQAPSSEYPSYKGKEESKIILNNSNVQNISSAPKNEAKTNNQNQIPESSLTSTKEDYSNIKPWLAVQKMQETNNFKSSEVEKLADFVFEYLCSFDIEPITSNKSVAQVWPSKKGSVKNLTETYTYLLNSYGHGIRCWSVRNAEGVFWNEVEINNSKLFYYDIQTQQKTSKYDNRYKNGFRYQ